MNNDSPEIMSIRRNRSTAEVEVKANIVTKIALSPADLAKAFWEMDGECQAEFFSHLGNIAAQLPFQLQAITDSPDLTHEGRRVMEMIGKYANRRGAES